MIKHVLVIGYIALVCIIVNRIFSRYNKGSIVSELVVSWLVLTTSMYAFGAFLVYFKN